MKPFRFNHAAICFFAFFVCSASAADSLVVRFSADLVDAIEVGDSEFIISNSFLEGQPQEITVLQKAMLESMYSFKVSEISKVEIFSADRGRARFKHLPGEFRGKRLEYLRPISGYIQIIFKREGSSFKVQFAIYASKDSGEVGVVGIKYASE